MKPRNSYYSIGCDDYLFAKDSLPLCDRANNYNSMVAILAQSAEKLMKEVIEQKFVDDSACIAILRTHNLRVLVNKIKERYPDSSLNSIECKWLGDFYFDARYPGDNYVVVSKEDAYTAIEIADRILDSINEILGYGE
ncbi:MAG: HEPN domain-containing protein [Lachnospiraceae bacterium]